MIQAVDTNSQNSTEKLGMGKLSEIFLKEILSINILKMRQEFISDGDCPADQGHPRLR